MIRIWATIALLLASLAPALGLGPTEPAARAQQALLPRGPAPTLQPNFRDAVYGDFLQVGNSVLRCPVAGEETGGNPAQECAAATANQTPGGLLDNRSNNNGYFMHQAEAPVGSGMFNASSAELEIPTGATVRYAQLHWGGHTGTFVGFSGVNCQRPILLQGQPPPPPSAPGPDRQAVKLGVDGTAPAVVDRDASHYTLTSGLAEPSEIYTDWADVTERFAGVRTGLPVEVTVGDVWAPSGPGCAGGWSLVVVFGYDEPHAPDFTALRVVDLYTGNLPKGGALLPGIIEPLVPGFPSVIDGLLPGLLPSLTGSSVVLPGVNPRRSAAAVTIGVTAYDGDWHQGGETLTVDGQAVTDPCLNDGTEDFFRSCANGAIDPLDPAKRPQNNLSVESKTFMADLPDNDTGRIELGVNSVADFFVLQNVVLAETVDPGIEVINTGPAGPVRQGDLASFDIQVTNTGSLPLFDVKLEDTSDPPSAGIRCTPATIQPLDPGQSRSVTCVQPAGATGFTNTATVSAAFVAAGDTTRRVSDSDTAQVAVTPADFAIQRVPDKLVTHAGEPVTFAVMLINNTDGATLTDLVYSDAEDARCDGPDPQAELAPRSTIEFACVVASPQATFTSSGLLTAMNGTQQVTVTSMDITVVVIDAVLDVEFSVDKDTIYRGDTVTFTFTVTNTSDDPDETISDIGVSIAKLPDCEPDRIEELAPGASATVTCTSRPTRTADLVATATGTDVTDTPVTGTSGELTITVLDPVLTIEQAVDHATIRVGGEVTWTFTVENIGDGPLSDVRIRNATIPNCEPEPIPSLAAGATATRTCSASPDRTFDSVASASAVDEAGRPMEVLSDPLRILVINPAMTITTTPDPDRARHGAAVRFDVAVRNIGDVPLTLAVTNDQAGDCDFTVTGAGLAPGAAQGRQCTTTTPTAESETELTNVASFSAEPVEEIQDDGDPITGEASATIQLTPGQAPPEPTPGPGPGNGPGTGGGSGSGGGGSGAGSGNNQGQGLAVTGASLVVPMVLAGTLIGAGLLLSVAARRPDEDDDGFLARWWPGN